MARKKKKNKKRVFEGKKDLPERLGMPEVKNEEPKVKATKIRVVGIGGGGSSIVSEIASRITKASFVAANTDSKALKEVNKNVIRFQFGEDLTRGLGTGMNPEIGETAALNEKDKIKNLFEGQDLSIIVACLGSGTGSGAAPIFAKISKNLGNLTYGIFTLPFAFEGEKKMAIAKAALEKIKPRLHALSVIPNERIFQIIQKETPLRQALSAINDRLAAALEGLIEIIYDVGLINIDFADFRTILQGQGRLAYLNTIRVQKKEGAVQEAIEKLLNSPLYPYSIKGAKSVLYNIAGEKGLTLSEVSQISKTISELVNKEAKIIFGVSQNQKFAGVIKTTLLATGCGNKIFAGGGKETRKKTKKNSGKKSASAKTIDSAVSGKKSPENKKKTNKKPKINKRRAKRFKAPKIKIIPTPENEIGTEAIFTSLENKNAQKVRKNALQLKKEAEAEEAIMLAREQAWEVPAFLRRKKII
ncbi:MAG: cell division protein FtsZ [Candidatus Pacebacteria bacterium]|nr:cell division protein FtsZ [Candidatus Paceibacterota bacterium]